MKKFGRLVRVMNAAVYPSIGAAICLTFELLTLLIITPFVWFFPGKRLTAEEANAEGPRDYLSRK